MQYEDLDCELINMGVEGKCHTDPKNKLVIFELEDGRTYRYILTPDGWDVKAVVKDRLAGKLLKLLKDEFPNGVDEVRLGQISVCESMSIFGVDSFKLL